VGLDVPSAMNIERAHDPGDKTVISLPAPTWRCGFGKRR
jgi:hypothetical protein